MRPLLLLATCAVLASCGGDDDANLSAEDYRKKQNELCQKASRELDDLDVPRSPGELADFLERGLELGRKYDRRARELDPPEELEELHREGVRLSDRLNAKFESLIERVRSAQDPLVAFQNGLQKLLGDIQQADDLNRRLKLDECLEVPGLRGSGQGPA